MGAWRLIKMTITRTEVLTYLDKCTLLELDGLISEIKDRFNIPEPVPLFIEPIEEIEVEEQTEFDVILITAGQYKIKVIKEVRHLSGLGLRESKTLVDSAPETILKNVSIRIAEEAKHKLEMVGAEIKIK